MEISFQKINLEHKELLESYLEKRCYRPCESVFANLYLWNRAYQTRFAIFEDALIFCNFSDYSKDERGVTFPIGEPDAIKRAIEQLLVFFEEKGKKFRLHLVQPCEFEMLEQLYPGRFEIEYERDLFDYVYEREQLATLSGRKLHGKRNHISKFQQLYPDWAYETISKENIEDCFQMAMEWRKEHCEGDEADDEIRNEVCVTMNALRLMDELSLRGGLLRVEGEVIAFTIGEPLLKDTFVIHIEKAFGEMQGAYPMINQQFILHEVPEEFAYVNREEDTGVEGLRRAKLSYRPAFMVEKGTVRMKGGQLLYG